VKVLHHIGTLHPGLPVAFGDVFAHIKPHKDEKDCIRVKNPMAEPNKMFAAAIPVLDFTYRTGSRALTCASSDGFNYTQAYLQRTAQQSQYPCFNILIPIDTDDGIQKVEWTGMLHPRWGMLSAAQSTAYMALMPAST
jgi:hypothetical protein